MHISQAGTCRLRGMVMVYSQVRSLCVFVIVAIFGPIEIAACLQQPTSHWHRAKDVFVYIQFICKRSQITGLYPNTAEE